MKRSFKASVTATDDCCCYACAYALLVLQEYLWEYVSADCLRYENINSPGVYNLLIECGILIEIMWYKSQAKYFLVLNVVEFIWRNANRLKRSISFSFLVLNCNKNKSIHNLIVWRQNQLKIISLNSWKQKLRAIIWTPSRKKRKYFF